VQDHLARCVDRFGAARPRSLTRPGAACRAWFEQTFGMLSTRRLDLVIHRIGGNRTIVSARP
jgi:hypothetical protein